MIGTALRAGLAERGLDVLAMGRADFDLYLATKRKCDISLFCVRSLLTEIDAATGGDTAATNERIWETIQRRVIAGGTTFVQRHLQGDIDM